MQSAVITRCQMEPRIQVVGVAEDGKYSKLTEDPQLGDVSPGPAVPLQLRMAGGALEPRSAATGGGHKQYAAPIGPICSLCFGSLTRRPVLKFAVHLPLRGHAAIKLAANPNTTTRIFAMRTAPALGRRLTAIGSAERACFFIASTQIGLFHFFLGTNCFETVPTPLGVVTVALRSRATALRRSDEKADVVLLGSHIAA